MLMQFETNRFFWNFAEAVGSESEKEDSLPLTKQLKNQLPS